MQPGISQPGYPQPGYAQPGFSTPPPPPVMADNMVRPSKWWFGVAALVGAAGLGVAVVLVVLGAIDYSDRIDDFQRADLPAALDVEITDVGGYSIYHEYDGASDDDAFRFVRPPSVSVVDPSGNEVALGYYVGDVSYSARGHEGEGLLTFRADVPGTYRVSAQGEAGSGIAVGRGLGRGLPRYLGGAALAGLVGLAAGAVIAIVVGVKRRNSRRSLMPAPAFSGWGPAPGWGGPPPPP